MTNIERQKMLQTRCRKVTVYEYEGEEYTAKDLLERLKHTGRYCDNAFRRTCKRHGVGEAQVLGHTTIRDWREIYNIMKPLEELRSELDITD
jgi:hypothetical protein